MKRPKRARLARAARRRTPSRLYRIAAASTFSLISIPGAQQRLQTCVCGGHPSLRTQPPPHNPPPTFFSPFLWKVTFTHMLVHLIVQSAGKARRNKQKQQNKSSSLLITTDIYKVHVAVGFAAVNNFKSIHLMWKRGFLPPLNTREHCSVTHRGGQQPGGLGLDARVKGACASLRLHV